MAVWHNRVALAVVGLTLAVLSGCVTVPGTPVGPESSDAVTVSGKLGTNDWGQYGRELSPRNGPRLGSVSHHAV